MCSSPYLMMPDLGNMENSVIYENIDSGHPCFIMLMGTANVV